MDRSFDKTKTCPKCKAPFTCSPVDCWCFSLPPVMPLTEGAECYCPSCLNALISEEIANKE